MKEIFYDFYGYNVVIFYFINQLGNHSFIPQVSRYISIVFELQNFSIYYVLLCIFQYFRLKKSNFDSKLYYDIFNEMVKIGICYAFFGFTYAALKFSFDFPRPNCSLQAENFITILSHDHLGRCLSSLPSAHIGLATMVTILAWSYLNWFWRICSIFFVAFMGLARITLAMHYPADVIYGCLTAFLVVAISQLVFAIFDDNLIRYIAEKLKVRLTPK